MSWGKDLRQSFLENRDMIDRIGTMNAGVKGESDWEGRTARILYSAFAGWDGQLVQACCGATYKRGYDGVLVAFDPDRIEGGPVSIVVSVPDGDRIKLQRGHLWMAPGGEHAVLVPHGVGKRYGHYAVENGRIVQRQGWPAATLERGTRRAEARLAELTADYARAALAREGVVA